MEFTITPVAQSHFNELLSSQEEGTGIRVFVINPGSINAECGVAYCPLKSIEETDYEIDFTSFKVYIDNVSYSFLDEAVIDIQEDEMQNSSLTIKAPNAKMKKVADDAPLLDRVDYFITTVVNPQLKNHGGEITLVSIEDGAVIIQFGGGCNGCSMADVTLKQGIEKQLLEQFAGEVSAVRDVTEHVTGDHSFYK